MSDNVNKPAHYNAGEVETIDGIRSALGEGFADYCKGNVIKYVWRCGLKGDGVEDLRKAATYLQWAIEAMGGNCPVVPDSSDRKPIAIPAGWRELEPDEVPLATDMHEWMGGWYYRNDDATCEYKWHDFRHVRKIEPDEPKPIAIPEGWRELEPDEFPRVTDMYENEGAWRKRINDSSIEYARYDVRQIRKIEPANPSETPNSSQPDPGEGYRLLSKEPPERLLDTDEGFFTRDGGLWLSVNYSGGDQLPLVYYRRKIETANTSEIPNSSTPTEWIPKVGDKVKVVGNDPKLCGDRAVVYEVNSCSLSARVVSYDGRREGWLRFEDLELIEAAP